ncbi:MAG: flagellar FliJ family protein [bacterium]|nr:flagellar FliJ family protein [bacterium]
MAKFQFRLERILDVKKIREELRQRDWVEAMRETERQAALEQQIRQEQILFREQRNQKGSVGELKIEAELAGGMRRKVKKQTAQVAFARQTELKKKGELIDAMRERKVMEKLREKKQDEYLLEERRTENKLIDEMAGNRFRQKFGL